MSRFGPAPAAGGGGAAAVYPWLIDVGILMSPIAVVGAWQVAQRSYVYGGILNNSNGAQGDSAAWDVVLGAGTWTLEVMRYTGGDSGKETWALDDGAGAFTDLVTFDDYAAVGVDSALVAAAGIPVVGTFKRRLRVTSAPKNAASTGFYLRMQHAQLRRTA